LKTSVHLFGWNMGRCSRQTRRRGKSSGQWQTLIYGYIPERCRCAH